MPHTSELRWSGVAGQATNTANATLDAVLNGEERYQRLLVAYNDAGGTDQDFADLLFQAVPATADQVAMVTDLRESLVACHDLYLALTNNAVAAEDRAGKLRRFVD